MSPGWRVATACTAALLVVPALVIWRSTQVDGAWLVALRVTAAVAVAGLLAACWLAVRHALTPPPAPERRELVLRVEPGETRPVTSVVHPTPSPDGERLGRAAGLALTAVAPVLLVVVLAVPTQIASGTADSTQPTATSEPERPPPGDAGPSPTVEPSPTSSPEPPTPPPEPPPAPPPAPPPDSGSAPTCTLTVRAGDTLWGLAAERLGPTATDAEIDRAWRADYAVNAAVVGPDPDLIVPGQVLVVPCQARPG